MKLMFVYLFLLLIQPKPGSSEANDTTCLTQLHASLNPTTSNPNLQNWTQPYFTTPCFNSFNSHISGITCNNNRVYRISLPNSGLSGSLSPSLSFCSDLQTLDLSDNSLAGDIPETLSALSNLAVLRLNNNRLSSVIPTSLYLCAYLNVLDLRNNLLTGPVPAQLGLLARLRILELSNNRLSGMIPESLRRFNASSFEGNVGLFGYPLGPGRKGGGGGGLSVGAIVGIGVGSGVVSLVVSFVVVCVWLKVSEHKLELAQQAKISQLMPDY